MNIRKVSYALALVAMFAFAATASAQGPALGANTSSNLEMTASVETAVQLNISGTAVIGSNSTGLFSVAFGNVNALGIANAVPTTGVTVSASGSGALYTTPISLTPIFTGFGPGFTASIGVTAGISGDEDLAREGDSVGSLNSPSLTPRPVMSGKASESSNAQVVGFFIPRAEIAGNKTATLIYAITVVDE
jgi:hypothetical protein